MLPRAAPRPRAGACTLESSLRCLRTSDHRVLRGVLEIRENRPPPDDAGPALHEPASAYPEARMLPRAAPRPRAGACTLESSLRCLRTSDHRALPWDVKKYNKIDLPLTMLDRRFKSRHLLTQRRACCPGLPRGPEQAPAPWSPPSAACAPRIIEFSRGMLKNITKSTSPRRCWTGASRAGICLPRGAHAAPGCPEAPSRRLHPGVLPPLPAHVGSSSSPVGCWKFEKTQIPPTMLDRRFKSRHLLTQRRACCPGLPRGPEQAPAPWSPPSAACAPPIIEFSRGVLEISENRLAPDDAGPALQEPASAYPEARMLPRAAPRPRAGACTLESSLRCLRTSDHRVLRGVLEIRENRPPPDDAGPALQEPASAYPEARMLPRAAPRPRAGACTLESSLRCLRTSDHRVLPWDVKKYNKIDLPPTMLDRRFKSRHLLTQRRACCPGLPRGPEQAPAPWSPPSAACAPRIIEFSGGCWKFEKIDLPRRCWTGASRAGICLPRGAHAAPGCPEAPSRRLHPGVLPPLPAHLGSSSSPVGC
jgi:hypothetical protein